MSKKIVRLTEADLHNIITDVVASILSEGTDMQNSYLRSLCKKHGIQYDPKYDMLSTKDASRLISTLKALKRGEQAPTIEQMLQAPSAPAAPQKSPVCAFNNYEDVTPDMVNRFWSKPEYARNLVGIDNVRPEFQQAYETAKKNVAMLDYAMRPGYTIFFDRHGNLNIMINSGASWSAQNHLHHYALKCRDHFSLNSSAWSAIDNDKWELLYDGKKRD